MQVYLRWMTVFGGSTQSPILSETGNEHRLKVVCGWGGKEVKAGMAHLMIIISAAGKAVWFLVHTCHTWAVQRWIMIKHCKNLQYLSRYKLCLSLHSYTDTADYVTRTQSTVTVSEGQSDLNQQRLDRCVSNVSSCHTCLSSGWDDIVLSDLNAASCTTHSVSSHATSNKLQQHNLRR